jgi:hypothetical protein
VEVLDHAGRKTRITEDLGDLLNNSGCLGGRFQYDGVTGQKCWYQRVDENEVRIL